MVKTWYFPSGGHGFAAVRVLPTQALQTHHVFPGIEASQSARIPSPLVEPPVLVLWLNKVADSFCGELPQNPHADFSRQALPCTGLCPRLRLAFLATMRPALDPVQPPGPSSQAYLYLHSLEALEG
jgi:hypothetical protein